ncbi:hypothetical protein Esti_002028 [Eimeria stiedai]
MQQQQQAAAPAAAAAAASSTAAAAESSPSVSPSSPTSSSPPRASQASSPAASAAAVAARASAAAAGAAAAASERLRQRDRASLSAAEESDSSELETEGGGAGAGVAGSPASSRRRASYRINFERSLHSPSLQRSLMLCVVGTCVFLVLGLFLIFFNSKQIECRLNYEDYSLGDGGTRYESLPITADACSPAGGLEVLEGDEVLVYYELEGLNQNGGQVVWSRSDKQLAGHIFTDPKDVEECEPYATKVVNNVTKVLHPCGALAWHVFTDNYLFFDAPPDGPAGSVKPLALQQGPQDILGSSRWKSLYRNPSASAREAARDKVYFWMSVEDNDDGRDGRGNTEEGLAWAVHEALNYEEAGAMVENSHFIQWMEVAALPTFRKLYGRLKGPLKLPLYAYISINFDVKPWGGRKAVVLVVPSLLRGGTLYLAIAYIVFGCVLLIFCLYLLWRLHLANDPHRPGDAKWKSVLARKRKKHKLG